MVVRVSRDEGKDPEASSVTSQLSAGLSPPQVISLERPSLTTQSKHFPQPQPLLHYVFLSKHQS